MSKYSMLGEEYYERRDELNPKEQQLYELIVFHTFQDSGLCSKTIAEICDIWNLEYHNTMRRYKVLRGEFRQKLQKNVVYPLEAQARKDKLKSRIENMKSPFLVEENGRIRPLVGIVWASQQESVKATLARIAEGKSVKVTPESVKTTLFPPNSSVKVTPESVKTTLPIYKDAEPFQSQEVHTAPPEALTRGGRGETNGHKSEFSKEECLRWVEMREKRGEKFDNPHGLANSAYLTGDYDVFISAMLYPEILDAPEAAEPIVYEYDTGGNLIPKPLTSYQFKDALEHLIQFRFEGFDIDDLKKYYTPEDWKALTLELEKCETN